MVYLLNPAVLWSVRHIDYSNVHLKEFYYFDPVMHGFIKKMRRVYGYIIIQR